MMMTMARNPIKTRFPLTMLVMMGREWQAEFYMSQLSRGYSAVEVQKNVETTLNQVLTFDY